MKTILPLFIFFLITGNLSAQDTILKRSNELIIAKILEISPTEIRFKKFNFQDGPTYVEKKSDVKFVIYSNGLKEEFQEQQHQSNTNKTNGPTSEYFGREVQSNKKIEIRGARFKFQDEYYNERELHDLLLKTKNKQIIGFVGQAKDAKALQYIGFGAIPFGIGAMYFLAKSQGAFYNGNNGTPNTSYSNDFAASAICLIGTISCPIISGIYKHKRTNSNHTAIKLYNEKY